MENTGAFRTGTETGSGAEFHRGGGEWGSGGSGEVGISQRADVFKAAAFRVGSFLMRFPPQYPVPCPASAS